MKTLLFCFVFASQFLLGQTAPNGLIYKERTDSSPTRPTTDCIEVVVSPNPVQNTLHLDLGCQVESGRLSLFTFGGRFIQEVAVREQKEIHLDVSSLPAGIYFFTLKGEGFSIGKQFVIQR